MYSILMDELPDSYRGVLLRTSFRVGIQITTMLDEVDGCEGTPRYTEVLSDCLQLLFGVSIPDVELAIEGLRWFMLGGKRELKNYNTAYHEEDKTEELEDVPDDSSVMGISKGIKQSEYTSFNFYYDSGKIYSAFRKVYNIDLHTCELHWFEFLYLMEDLGECLLSKAIEYRTANISKLKGEQKKHYLEMRRKFSIPVRLNAEDIAQIESTGLSLDDIEQYMQY